MIENRSAGHRAMRVATHAVRDHQEAAIVRGRHDQARSHVASQDEGIDGDGVLAVAARVNAALLFSRLENPSTQSSQSGFDLRSWLTRLFALGVSWSQAVNSLADSVLGAYPRISESKLPQKRK
jgi:hypothetical protein